MSVLVDRLGAAWLDGALGAAVVLGLAALAMVGCGQPSRRCLLARGAILGSLAILPLSYFAPVPRLPVVRTWRAIAWPRAPAADGPAAGPEAGGQLAEACGRVLVPVAVAGSAAGLGMIAMGGLGALRLVRKTVEPAPETRSLYDALPFRSLLPRPRLRVSARVRAPVLVGTIRPTILIPPDLDEPEEAGPLRLGLLHEMAHAERLDPWFGLASALAGATWFFLPPLWWVRGQMRLDQEFLADLRASGEFGPKVSYASSLVGLAEAPAAGSAPSLGLGGSALLLRVLMLVRCPYPVEARPPRWWRWSCPIVLAALTWFASGLSLRGMASAPMPGDPSCPSNIPKHGVLQVARLTVEVPKPGPDGCPRPYTLLRALPRRFEMIVDVWADPADLPKIAIAGRFLGPPLSKPGDPPLTEGYHRVRLLRDHGDVTVWVAGRLVPPRSDDRPPPALLSVTPAPGTAGRFRDLLITW